MKNLLPFAAIFFCVNSYAQTNWINIDAGYGSLPSSFHVYRSVDSVDGKPNVMYYAVADLHDTSLLFTADTSFGRRLTPTEYFVKNDQPLLIANATFFSFATNQNLNVVVKDGKTVSMNMQSFKGNGEDSILFYHPFFGTFGISDAGRADVAWTFSDSSNHKILASQTPVRYLKTNNASLSSGELLERFPQFTDWHVQAAVGGGPVLVQNGEVKVTNNEERKFAGKAINDRHPRTAIGYTGDNKLIVFVCEGRSETAAGLTLTSMAKIMKEIGCVEALNLDGGGSSCMLINGKETNLPSSKGVQRQVPSIFMIQKKKH